MDEYRFIQDTSPRETLFSRVGTLAIGAGE